MSRNNEENVQGSTLQISIGNRKKNPSKLPEKLELRGFATIKGINRPNLKKFT